MTATETAYAAAKELIRKHPTDDRSEFHFGHLPELNRLPPEISAHKNTNVLGLDNTQITDLEPIAGLSKLTGLGLSHTPISSLAPIADLTKLKKLLLDESQVVDLAPIRNFQQLEELSLNKTNVTDLGPLALLVSLK